MLKKNTLELKWAVIFSVVTLLWMLLEKQLGWHDELIADHATYTNIFALVAIAVYVFALREKKQQLGDTVTYRRLLISGAIISVLVAFLSPLVQWITHSFITTNYFSNSIAYAVSTGTSSQEEADRYFNLNSYILQSGIGALLMGLITSAIVALFFRK